MNASTTRRRSRIPYRDPELAPRDPDTGLPGLTGRELCRLMRRHKVTIRELATRTGNAPWHIRRLREFRMGFLASLDYWQAITGAVELDARRKAQLQQWRDLKASGQRVTSFADQE